MPGWSFARACRVGKVPLLVAAMVCVAGVHTARAQQRTMSGWFHTIWVDPHRPSVPANPIHVLIDDAGHWTRLDLDDATLRRAGGVGALNRHRVTVSGSVTGPAPFSTTVSAMRVSSFNAATVASDATMPTNPELGTKPYVVILCKFSDSTAVPFSRSVYERWVSTSFPGMGDYWREVSGGSMNIDGSEVLGWYTLPHPYTYYYPNGSQGDSTLSRLMNDCTVAADADVDFPQFAGVILQFNGDAAAAWGGSAMLTLDGQTKTYGMTWMPNWSTPATYAHEMGHTLGWMHSHGPYNLTYDSDWDVMSYPYGWQEYTVAPSTWVAEQTIAFNKAYAGWIPASRILVPAMPSRQSVLLERSVQPTSGAGYLLVRIPTSGDTSYTAEARRFIGYDRHLPGEAVILHTLDMNRPEWAWVVDVDGNGNPNDAGAMWTPGETFTDSLHGVAMTVDSVTPTGFGVTITRGWRLELLAQGAGTITSSATGTCSGSCSTLLGTHGQTVTLSATPNAGSVFAGWSGACTGTGPCTVTMLGDRSVTARFSITLTIVSDSLRAGAVMGAPYADTLAETGGTPQTRWAVTKGALPPGLALDSATGIVHGIPEQAGRFSFTVLARSDTLSGSRPMQLTVVKPVLPAASVMDQLLGAGTPLSADAVRFLDLEGNKNGHLDVGDVRAWLMDTGAIASKRIASDTTRAIDRARLAPSADRTSTGAHRAPEQQP